MDEDKLKKWFKRKNGINFLIDVISLGGVAKK
jgi:hypothetical protein